MKTAMGNGTSALLSFQKAMAVESHNAGNVKSLAYKADTVSFADMFYSQSVGLGVSMDTPRKDFSQGGLVPTNSEYDFAIDGEGFFQLQDPNNPNQPLYSRAGQFISDKNNNLSDLNGMLVMGLKPNVSGDIISSEYVNSIASTIVKSDDQIRSINTYITDYQKGIYYAGSTGESGNNYKTSDNNLADVEKLIYHYKSALKSYSINPVNGESATKHLTDVKYTIPSTDTGEYTVELTINGVKFQQEYEDSIENTLKLFSDKLNGFAGITSSVDTTTGIVSVESMAHGQILSITKGKLNGNNVTVETVSQGGGSGALLKDAIYAELTAILAPINTEIDTKVSILEKDETTLTTLEKESIKSLINFDSTLYQALSDDEKATRKSEAISFLQEVRVSVATNESSISHPTSGASLTLTPIELDLHKLGMNSTLYEKILSGDPTKVASYPGIESEDGYLYLRDGDAKYLVGKLPTLVISDKTQLRPEGDNLYTLTGSDITPVYIEGIAKVVGRNLEYSNVDISEQLVNLLSYQKAFEANSKSISTSDEMMKTALALKNK